MRQQTEHGSPELAAGRDALGTRRPEEVIDGGGDLVWGRREVGPQLVEEDLTDPVVVLGPKEAGDGRDAGGRELVGVQDVGGFRGQHADEGAARR